MLQIPHRTFEEGFYAAEISDCNDRPDRLVFNNLSDGRQVPATDFTLKLFCRRCNNGWMADLETRAKSILGTRLTANSVDLAFNPEDAFELARWVILKSVVLARASQCALEFTPAVYASLLSGQIPNGVVIDVYELSSIGLNWFIGPISVRKAIDISRAKLDRFGAICFVIGLHVGKLAFRCSFVPDHPSIKRTQTAYRPIVLYPEGYSLPFNPCEIPPVQGLEFHILCSSLGLVDYPPTQTYSG